MKKRERELHALKSLWKSGLLVGMKVKPIGSRQAFTVDGLVRDTDGGIFTQQVRSDGRYWNIDAVHLLPPLTPGVAKALRILIDHPQGMKPRRFADLMWPDSPCHNRSYPCGAYGSTKGSGLRQSAGSFLGKLRKMKLAAPSMRGAVFNSDYNNYIITTEGKLALKRMEAYQRLEI